MSLRRPPESCASWSELASHALLRCRLLFPLPSLPVPPKNDHSLKRQFAGACPSVAIQRFGKLGEQSLCSFLGLGQFSNASQQRFTAWIAARGRAGLFLDELLQLFIGRVVDIDGLHF